MIYLSMFNEIEDFLFPITQELCYNLKDV